MAYALWHSGRRASMMMMMAGSVPNIDSFLLTFFDDTRRRMAASRF